MFKLWSQTKPGTIQEMKPDLGLRSWNDLEEKDKHIIWKHLEWFFFDESQSDPDGMFFGDVEEKEVIKLRIYRSITWLNNKYKAKNYAANFLEDWDLTAACTDFYNLFLNQSENVVLELLSLYCKAILREREEKEPYRPSDESDKDFEKRANEWRFADLDSFAGKLNEVFEDFGLEVYLSRDGFIPKQDKKITEEIYKPVLSFLSEEKWQKVNEHLSDAFKDYGQKDYSGSITNTITAVQAYLQILVSGDIGKGQISDLITQAQAKSLIPKDQISKQIFKNMESIFASERKQKGMAHPRIESPKEENARAILNLAMVFIQHCIQGT